MKYAKYIIIYFIFLFHLDKNFKIVKNYRAHQDAYFGKTTIFLKSIGEEILKVKIGQLRPAILRYYTMNINSLFLIV